MKTLIVLPLALALTGCLDDPYSSSVPASRGCSITYTAEPQAVGVWETFTDSQGNILYSAGAGAAHPNPCDRARFLGLTN
jgi:hypothetical protein